MDPKKECFWSSYWKNRALPYIRVPLDVSIAGAWGIMPISQMRKCSSDIKKLAKVTQPLSAKYPTGSVLAATASTPEAPRLHWCQEQHLNCFLGQWAQQSTHTLPWTPRTWDQAGKLSCPPQPLHLSVRVETGGLRKLMKEALSTP